MKKSLFAIAAAAAVLAGCQMSEPALNTGKSAEFSQKINATIVDGTRAALAQDGEVWHVNWEVGDKILVTADGKADTYYTEFGGSNQATFWWSKGDTVVIDGLTDIVAYSPASLISTTSDVPFLPSFQGYKEGSASFIPMMAQSTDENLAFKNLCGVIKLNLTTTAADIVVNSISIKADQGLSGSFEVVDGAAVVDGTEGVTLKSSEGVAISGTAVPFYITVPAGTYTGMEITATTVDGKSQTIKMKAGSSFTVERSMIHEGNFAFNDFVASSVTKGGICTLTTGTELNIALKTLTDPSGTFAADTKITAGPTKIVLSTNDLSTIGVEVGDISSDQPAYASYDPVSGVITIASPADEFQLNYDASNSFYGFRSVTEIVGLEKLKSDKSTSLAYCFAYCSGLTKIDLASFNTENVEQMQNMFWYCQKATEINVSTFNTENVTNMHSMFCHCDALPGVNVSNFVTGGVTDFGYMFSYDDSLLSIDLKDFDTSGATTMSYMFYDSDAFTELDLDLDFSSVSKLSYMFAEMDNLQVLKLGDKCNVNHAPTMSYMFVHMPMLREMWLGEGFIPDNRTKPSNFFAYTGTTDFDKNGNCIRTASAGSSLTIHCNQDQADWLATTGLRWLPTGYKTENGYWPITVTFLDYTSGQELSVTWSPN